MKDRITELEGKVKELERAYDKLHEVVKSMLWILDTHNNVLQERRGYEQL